MNRFRNLMVVFGVLLGITSAAQVEAQSNYVFGSDYVCLQYPVYFDGTQYLFLGDDYNSSCSGNSVGENYYWVYEDQVPASLPQICTNCFAPGTLGAIQRKKGVVQAKAEDSAADVPFPDVSKTEKLLPTTFRFGNDKSNQALPAIGPNGEFKPSAGITLISSQWVRVTTKDGKTIPVKLFTAQLDYAAAGITDAPNKTKIIRLGFEMTPPKELTSIPTVKPIQKSKDTKFNGDVKLTVDSDSFTYRIVTQTPLF